MSKPVFKMFGDRTRFGNVELSYRKLVVLVMLDRIKADIESMPDDGVLAEILMSCDEFCIVAGPADIIVGEAREPAQH